MQDFSFVLVLPEVIKGVKEKLETENKAFIQETQYLLTIPASFFDIKPILTNGDSDYSSKPIPGCWTNNVIILDQEAKDKSIDALSLFLYIDTLNKSDDTENVYITPKIEGSIPDVLLSIKKISEQISPNKDLKERIIFFLINILDYALINSSQDNFSFKTDSDSSIVFSLLNWINSFDNSVLYACYIMKCLIDMSTSNIKYDFFSELRHIDPPTLEYPDSFSRHFYNYKGQLCWNNLIKIYQRLKAIIFGEQNASPRKNENRKNSVYQDIKYNVQKFFPVMLSFPFLVFQSDYDVQKVTNFTEIDRILKIRISKSENCTTDDINTYKNVVYKEAKNQNKKKAINGLPQLAFKYQSYISVTETRRKKNADDVPQIFDRSEQNYDQSLSINKCFNLPFNLTNSSILNRILKNDYLTIYDYPVLPIFSSRQIESDFPECAIPFHSFISEKSKYLHLEKEKIDLIKKKFELFNEPIPQNQVDLFNSFLKAQLLPNEIDVNTLSIDNVNPYHINNMVNMLKDISLTSIICGRVLYNGNLNGANYILPALSYFIQDYLRNVTQHSMISMKTILQMIFHYWKEEISDRKIFIKNNISGCILKAMRLSSFNACIKAGFDNDDKEYISVLLDIISKWHLLLLMFIDAQGEFYPANVIEVIKLPRDIAKLSMRLIQDGRYQPNEFGILKIIECAQSTTCL